MSEPYVYTDPYGYNLQICPSGVAKGDVKIGADVAVDVPAADLPEIVAKMYKAAGQQEPIILPRYEADATMTRGRKVRPMLIPSGEDMTIAEARDLASWYATAADLADAEPDPQLIAHLADVVTRAGVLGSAAETIARAVLAAGYDKAGES